MRNVEEVALVVAKASVWGFLRTVGPSKVAMQDGSAGRRVAKGLSATLGGVI
jgi:hypothetical protein